GRRVFVTTPTVPWRDASSANVSPAIPLPITRKSKSQVIPATAFRRDARRSAPRRAAVPDLLRSPAATSPEQYAWIARTRKGAGSRQRNERPRGRARCHAIDTAARDGRPFDGPARLPVGGGGRWHGVSPGGDDWHVTATRGRRRRLAWRARSSLSRSVSC